MSTYQESVERLKREMSQTSGDKLDERYLKPTEQAIVYDDATERLRQTLKQVLPDEPAETNIPVITPIALVHEFASENELVRHMEHVKHLDDLSNKRELAALRGDEVTVQTIDAEIRQANRAYAEGTNAAR